MNLPLAGQTILVTRPIGQEQTLIQQLGALGATVLYWPALTMAPPLDWSAFDTNVRNLAEFHWAVFTSANGVRACFERLQELGLPNDLFKPLQLAAIGPATAAKLQSYVVNSILLPTQNDTAGFLIEIAPQLTGQRALLFRAEQGRTDLRDGLQSLATVADVIVYRQVPTTGPTAAIQTLLDAGQVDVVVLTSPNSARAIIAHLSSAARHWINADRTRFLVNSDATRKAVIEFGLPAALMANGSTVEHLVAGVRH